MKKQTAFRFIPDLADEIAGQLQQASAETNIQGRAIYADGTVKVLLLPFAAGQNLHEHVTPHPAILQVVEGSGELTLGSERMPVKAGSWAWLEGGLPHSVQAKTKMLLLLQVFLNERQGSGAA